MKHFTSLWAVTPSDGVAQPPPECPLGYVAVRYEDTGYHGGEYWAILPQELVGDTWAIAVDYYMEGNTNTLLSVGGEGAPSLAQLEGEGWLG